MWSFPASSERESVEVYMRARHSGTEGDSGRGPEPGEQRGGCGGPGGEEAGPEGKMRVSRGEDAGQEGRMWGPDAGQEGRRRG